MLSSHTTPTRQPLAIGDYALVGDCRTAALVGRDGSIDWLCLPNFSSPSVFAAVLDPGRGGRFGIRPAIEHRVERNYLDGTNVLQTRFIFAGGELRLTDAMTFPVDHERVGLLAQRELLRRVEAVGADVPLQIVFEPRPDYGSAPARLVSRGAMGWVCGWRDQLLLLRSEVPLAVNQEGRGLHAQMVLPAGQQRWLSLAHVCGDAAVVMPLREAACARLDAVARWWRQWVARCTYRGPYEEAVRRSVLTLKLLTFSLSGAVVAAPSCSLPEEVGGSRNWDYRYCWLRDASLTLEAFNGLGFHAEGEAFLEWLLHATRLTWPRLQVLYDVYGEARVKEYELDWAGYRGSRPVRVGNGAWDQSQLDVYGSVVMATAMHAKAGGTLNRDQCRMVAGLGRSVCRSWRNTDHGIWEMRDAGRHHTYSKATCWAALDCLVQLGEGGFISASLDDFRRERDAIRAAVEEKGFDPARGSYTGVFGGQEPDASLLLLPRYQYCAADDPRMIGTFRYIDARLAAGPLLYRYPASYGALEGQESPFGACSFWAVDYLAKAGRVAQARERFEQLLGYANDLGLYAEEIDARTGEAIGNFPQAFTHIALISAALSLAQAAPGGPPT